MFAACALAVAPAFAQSDCPPQIDLPAGNRAAEALFRQRALKPASSGSAAASRPAGFVEAAAHGARGDGIADDSAALQQALDQARKVWLAPQGVYRTTRRIVLPANAELASDGSATLLLDGFSNQEARKSERAIYGAQGTGLRVEGDDAVIRDLFVVKAFEDERYVIGIDVRAANRVRIQRVRLRGFSLAPGIITIRSSDDVEVSSSLIHDACTASTRVPADVPSFQITGISIDDARVGGRGSTRLVIENNVITDLRMIPRTYRGVQTDGIHFAAIGTGAGSVVRDNHVSNVDEALDIYGAGIRASANHLQATGTVVKLIHGARSVTIADNQIDPAGRALAVGLFRANPGEEARQVQDIAIEGNRFRAAAGDRAAIEVEPDGAYPPTRIAIRRNTFEVVRCQQAVVSCRREQCAESANRRFTPGDKRDC